MAVRGIGRRLLRVVLLFVIPCAVILAGLVVYARGGRFAETDNAYVKARVIAVSAEVAGRVVEVSVRDNEAVKAGAPLFRVDTAPVELAILRAEAQMAVVRTEPTHWEWTPKFKVLEGELLCFPCLEEKAKEDAEEAEDDDGDEDSCALEHAEP